MGSGNSCKNTSDTRVSGGDLSNMSRGTDESPEERLQEHLSVEQSWSLGKARISFAESVWKKMVQLYKSRIQLKGSMSCLFILVWLRLEVEEQWWLFCSRCVGILFLLMALHICWSSIYCSMGDAKMAVSFQHQCSKHVRSSDRLVWCCCRPAVTLWCGHKKKKNMFGLIVWNSS